MESTHGRLPAGVVVTARGEAGGLATRLVACCFAPAAPAERYGPACGGGTGAGVVVLRLADSQEARRELLGAAPATGPPPPMLRTEVVPDPSRRERTIARDAFLSYAVGGHVTHVNVATFEAPLRTLGAAVAEGGLEARHRVEVPPHTRAALAKGAAAVLPRLHELLDELAVPGRVARAAPADTEVRTLRRAAVWVDGHGEVCVQHASSPVERLKVDWASGRLLLRTDAGGVRELHSLTDVLRSAPAPAQAERPSPPPVATTEASAITSLTDELLAFRTATTRGTAPARLTVERADALVADGAVDRLVATVADDGPDAAAASDSCVVMLESGSQRAARALVSAGNEAALFSCSVTLHDLLAHAASFEAVRAVPGFGSLADTLVETLARHHEDIASSPLVSAGTDNSARVTPNKRGGVVSGRPAPPPVPSTPVSSVGLSSTALGLPHDLTMIAETQDEAVEAPCIPAYDGECPDGLGDTFCSTAQGAITAENVVTPPGTPSRASISTQASPASPGLLSPHKPPPSSVRRPIVPKLLLPQLNGAATFGGNTRSTRRTGTDRSSRTTAKSTVRSSIATLRRASGEADQSAMVSALEKLSSLAKEVGEALVFPELSTVIALQRRAARASGKLPATAIAGQASNFVSTSGQSYHSQNTRHRVACGIMRFLANAVRPTSGRYWCREPGNLMAMQLLDQGAFGAKHAEESGTSLRELALNVLQSSSRGCGSTSVVLGPFINADALLWRIRARLGSAVAMNRGDPDTLLELHNLLELLADYVDGSQDSQVAAHVVTSTGDALLRVRALLASSESVAEWGLHRLTAVGAWIRVMSGLCVQCDGLPKVREFLGAVLLMWEPGHSWIRGYLRHVLLSESLERALVPRVLENMRVNALRFMRAVVMLAERNTPSLEASAVEAVLARLVFSSDPVKGLCIRVLELVHGRGCAASPTAMSALAVLLEGYRAAGGRLIGAENVAEFHVRYQFREFVRLYTRPRSAAPGEKDCGASCAAELLKLHAQCLAALARVRTEQCVRAFYQLRVLDFLVRELDLEFESSQRERPRPQTAVQQPTEAVTSAGSQRLHLAPLELGAERATATVPELAIGAIPTLALGRAAKGMDKPASTMELGAVPKLQLGGAAKHPPPKLSISVPRLSLGASSIDAGNLDGSRVPEGDLQSMHGTATLTVPAASVMNEDKSDTGSDRGGFTGDLNEDVEMEEARERAEALTRSGNATPRSGFKSSFTGDLNEDVAAPEYEDRADGVDSPQRCETPDVHDLAQAAPSTSARSTVPKLRFGSRLPARHDESGASGNQPLMGLTRSVNGLSALEESIDSDNPKMQLVFGGANRIAKERKEIAAQWEQTSYGPASAEGFYEHERVSRRVYHDTELHLAVLEAVFALLLTADGDLQPLYTAQFPLQEGKLNVPFLLWHHLSHPANASIVGDLAARVGSAQLPGGVRLLRLVCRTVFHPEVYSARTRLARGAYAQVYRCMLPLLGATSPRAVAAKVIDVPHSIHDQCAWHDVFEELRVLEGLAGCNSAVELLDYGVDGDSLFIIQKAYKCSLKAWRSKHIRGASPGPLRLYLRVFAEVLRACAAVAAHGIVHYDLKADNVFLEALPGVTNEEFWSPTSGDGPLPFRVVVGDFGESRIFRAGEQAVTARNRGTEYIQSPEMLTISNADKRTLASFDRRRRPGAGLASDVWSAGCMLYEVIGGDFLFYDPDWIRFFLRVTSPGSELVPKPREAELREVHTPLVDFLEWLLVRDPDRRPTLLEAIKRFDVILTGPVPPYAPPLLVSDDDAEAPPATPTVAAAAWAPASVWDVIQRPPKRTTTATPLGSRLPMVLVPLEALSGAARGLRHTLLVDVGTCAPALPPHHAKLTLDRALGSLTAQISSALPFIAGAGSAPVLLVFGDAEGEAVAASLAAAALVARLGMNLYEALLVVSQARPTARPSTAQVRELVSWSESYSKGQ